MRDKDKQQNPPIETPPEQEGVLDGVVTTVEPLRLPTVGRIIQFRIDLDYEGMDVVEPTLRPALVLGDGPEPDTLMLQVFIHPNDTVVPGAGLRKAIDGFAFYAVAAEGDSCGQWRWPYIAPPAPVTDEQ